VESILKFLNSLPRGKARKVQGNASVSGEPDIDGCLSGRSLKIEVKRSEKEDASALQKEILKQWAQAGAVTGVVYDVAGVKEILMKEGLL
jgi:hypothetical protein